MSRKIIILVSVFLLFLLIHSYLVHGSTWEKKYELNESIVYDLLSCRANIMNRGLYSDEDINSIIMDLEELETGSLLKDDIESIKYARENPTDYPLIIGLKIEKIQLLTINANTYKLKALVRWSILDTTHELEENIEYFIEIQNQEGRFFLISIVPNE